jgi:putative alpha-1,2-mannosidase
MFPFIFNNIKALTDRTFLKKFKTRVYRECQASQYQFFQIESIHGIVEKG